MVKQSMKIPKCSEIGIIILDNHPSSAAGCVCSRVTEYGCTHTMEPEDGDQYVQTCMTSHSLESAINLKCLRFRG